MQATLVSFYGTKQDEFSTLINQIQKILSSFIGKNFHPYELKQVHATVIGLEGIYLNGEIINKYYWDYHREQRTMMFGETLEFLRKTHLFPFQIQIGGFQQQRDYSMSSQGKHPYDRSFSVQGNIPVAMGWPVANGLYPPVLHQIRRQLKQFNILHRYFKSKTDVDNDFYFALGRINVENVETNTIHEAEKAIRDYMANREPITITLDKKQIFVVGYSGSQIQVSNSSVAFSIADGNLNAETIRKLYTNTLDIDEGQVEPPVSK